MASTLGVWLSFLSLVSVSGQSDVIGSNEPVNVTIGDNAILPCHLEPPFDAKTLTVEWRRGQTLVHVYRSRRDDPVPQDESYKGRTSLFHDKMTKGNISLKLTIVKEQDAGKYMCNAPNLKSQVKKGYVTLIVAKPEKKGNKENQNDNPSTEPRPGNDGAIIGLAVAIATSAVVGFAILWCLYGAEH